MVIAPSVAFASWWNPFTWSIFNVIFHRAQPVQVVEIHAVEQEVKLTNNSSTTAETGTSPEIKPVLDNNDTSTPLT